MESGSPEVSLSPSFPSVFISVSCHVSLSHPNMSQFSVISALSLLLISLLHPPCRLSVLFVCLSSATCHPPISPSPSRLHARDSLYLSADKDLYLCLSFLRRRCLCPVPVCLCLCPSVPVSLHLISVSASSSLPQPRVSAHGCFPPRMPSDAAVQGGCTEPPQGD